MTKIQKDTFHRSAKFEKRTIDEENRTVSLAFSSESAVERYFGLEILGHGRGEIDLSFLDGGSAPLLLDHDRTKQIGVVETVSVDQKAKTARAVVRFGKSALAEEVFQDVRDEIRQNVSVGYRILKYETTEGKGDEPTTVRATLWKPFEISMVSIPADEATGVGREFENETIEQEDISMTKDTNTPEKDKPEAPKVDVQAERDQAVQAERARIANLTEMGRAFNMGEAAEFHIRNGKSVEEFKDSVLAEMRKRNENPIQTAAPAKLDMPEAEDREYSVMRAIRAAVAKDWSNAGLEKEASDTIAKRLNRPTTGFFLPADLKHRDMTAGTATEGAELVGTDHRGDLFVDALRNRLVMQALGAVVLDDLQGDVDIPKLTASANVQWVAENTAGTEQTPATGNINLSPETLTSYVDLSRRLMVQSSPSVEQMIRNDLLSAMAVGIDTAAIAGSGTSNQPLGVLNTPGIGAVPLGTNGAEPTWDSVNQLIEAVEVANADTAASQFLTNPKVVSKLRRTRKVTGTDSVMIMNGNDLIGYSVAKTNSVPSDLTKGTGTNLSALLFGTWSDVLIGMWGVMELTVDPYSLSTTGATRLVVHQDADVAVRRAESFAAISDMITT